MMTRVTIGSIWECSIYTYAFLSVLYFLLGIIISRYSQDKRFALIIFTIGYTFRMLVLTAGRVLWGNGDTAFRDIAYYNRTGRAIVEVWKNGFTFDLSTYAKIAGSRNWGYSLYNAVHNIVCTSDILPSISNVFIGALLPIIVLELSIILFDNRTARLATVLTASESGNIWFSTLNLKDTFVSFVFLYSLFMAAQLAQKRSAPRVAAIILSLSFLYATRFYIAILILPIIIIYWVQKESEALSARNVAIFSSIVIIISAIIYHLPGTKGTIYEIKRAGGIYEFIKEYTDRSFSNVYKRGSTGYVVLKNIPTALSFYVVLLYFSLNPSPFLLSGWRIILLPGIIMWYTMIPFFVQGLAKILKNKEQNILAITALSTFFIYSVFPNLSGVRHRLQILPVAFIISSYALINSKQKKVFIYTTWSIILSLSALMAVIQYII